MLEIGFVLVVLFESAFIAWIEWLRHHEKDFGVFKKLVNMIWHKKRDFHWLISSVLGYIVCLLGLPIAFLPVLYVTHWINSDGVFGKLQGRGYFDIATQSGNMWERFGGAVNKISALIFTVLFYFYHMVIYNYLLSIV